MCELLGCSNAKKAKVDIVALVMQPNKSPFESHYGHDETGQAADMAADAIKSEGLTDINIKYVSF